MFDVYDTTTQRQIAQAVEAAAAADLLDVGEDDLLWAVEECGRCDGETLCAVLTGSDAPDDDPLGDWHGRNA